MYTTKGLQMFEYESKPVYDKVTQKVLYGTPVITLERIDKRLGEGYYVVHQDIALVVEKGNVHERIMVTMEKLIRE